jgi:ATP-dependent Clp protease protease subunit
MDFSKDYLKYLKSSGISDKFTKGYTSKLMGNVGFDNFYPTDVYQKLVNDRIIILSGEIETNLCEYVKANLLYLESVDGSKDINIYINSPGGSVYDGLGLLDIMEYISPDISTINTGLAASMAAVILCSGAKGKRKSLKRSRTMIHQPMAGYGGYMQASDLEIDAKEIIKLKRELHTIISKNTGQEYSRVESDSDRDYWMDAKEAKKYGMIDEILIKR